MSRNPNRGRTVDATFAKKRKDGPPVNPEKRYRGMEPLFGVAPHWSFSVAWNSTGAGWFFDMKAKFENFVTLPQLNEISTLPSADHRTASTEKSNP
jgi:hypothetical protein